MARGKKAAVPTYLSRQFNTWTFQLRVPADCQPEVGKKTVRKSLGTTDVHEARRLAHGMWEQWQVRFDDIRAGKVGKDVAVKTLDQLGYEFPNINPESALWIAEFERRAAERKYRLRAGRLLAQLGPGVSVEPLLEPTRRENEARLAEVQAAVSLVTHDLEPASGGPKLETMQEAFNRWEREARPARSSFLDAKLAVRIWTELFPGLALEDISRRHVAEFRQAVLDYPSGIPASDRTLSARRLIEKYIGDTSKRPRPSTAMKKFGLVGAMVRLARKAGIIENDPFDGVTIDTSEKKEQRLPFSKDDLEKLFAKLPEQSVEFRWLATLCYATGARLAEILQLRASDVKTDAGITYIHITDADDEHGERSTKTRSSVRKVPIRAELAPALVEFAAGRSGLLLPSLIGQGLKPHAAASKVMASWIDRAGIKDKRKVAHSFRHLYVDMCQAAGIGEEVRVKLTGHSLGDNVGRHYGTGVPLHILANAVERLEFPVELVPPAA